MNTYRLSIIFECEANSEEEARAIHAKWLVGDWRNPGDPQYMTDNDVECEEVQNPQFVIRG